jgi:hypothetical protein
MKNTDYEQHVYWFTEAPSGEVVRNVGKLLRASSSGKTLVVERVHPVAGGTVKFAVRDIWLKLFLV